MRFRKGRTFVSKFIWINEAETKRNLQADTASGECTAAEASVPGAIPMMDERRKRKGRGREHESAS
jgi:hypothetical protein